MKSIKKVSLDSANPAIPDAAQYRVPADPQHPCVVHLRSQFHPPVCYNGHWLLDVFRFDWGGVGHASRSPLLQSSRGYEGCAIP